MNTKFANRLILVSSFSEIQYSKYIYDRCVKLNLNPLIITTDKIIYKYLLKFKINTDYLNVRVPSLTSKLTLKNILIIIRYLIFKKRLKNYFKKYDQIKLIYYYGGNCDKIIPFIIHYYKNLKIINFDYFNWYQGYKKLFLKIKKINFFFRNPKMTIHFMLNNFLSGSQYKFYLMKYNRPLTIKQNRYSNERIISPSKQVINKITNFYNFSRCSFPEKKKSIVIMYHENIFNFKDFKKDEAVKDIKFFIEFAKKKNYFIFFKLHPTADKNILNKYKISESQIIDKDLPIEDLEFVPDFFFGYSSSSFKFLNPKKKNLILNNENYISHFFNSIDTRLELKYLISNEKNVFSSSVISLSNYL